MMEVLIGVAGCVATVMVIAGMILITPKGTESAPARPAANGAGPAIADGTVAGGDRSAPRGGEVLAGSGRPDAGTRSRDGSPRV